MIISTVLWYINVIKECKIVLKFESNSMIKDQIYTLTWFETLTNAIISYAQCNKAKIGSDKNKH